MSLAASYTVAHLDCTPEQLFQPEGFKFIVTRTGEEVYQLFADAEKEFHLHIYDAMREQKKLSEEETVIGGGRMRLAPIAGRLPMLLLFDESSRYGREPEAVRQIFRPVVVAALKEIGIEAE